MKAVILAAGLGSRLEPLTRDVPKCMVPVAGVPLVDRMIARIAEAGIRELVVVTGYRRELLERHLAASPSELARGARTVYNERYADWGNFYSLLVAREAIGESAFIKLDGDVILDETILPRLLDTPGPVALALDCRDDLSEEDMKARVDADGAVVELNKGMTAAAALGESIGVERVDAAVSRALFEELGRMIERGATHEYYEHAYERLMQQGVRFSYADITGSLWCEVDDLGDLERAHGVIARQARPAS